MLVRNPELCGGLLELLHYHAIEMFGAWGDSTGEGGGGVELNLEKVLVHKVGQTGTYLCLSSFDFTGIFAKSIFIIFFKNCFDLLIWGPDTVPTYLQCGSVEQKNGVENFLTLSP